MANMLSYEGVKIKESAIYKIENIVNHKVYVGQTSWLKKRKTAHLNSLNKGTHFNVHLQNAWNKYGSSSFLFEIIEYCEVNNLDEREAYWINFYDSCNVEHGYNLKPGGSSKRGYKMSESAKENMRKNHCDVSGSKNPMYGKNIFENMSPEKSKEIRRKRSLASSGENNPFYGQKHTQESKQKISKANKGKLAGENNHFYGKKMPRYIVEKMMHSRLVNGSILSGGEHPNARKVVCLNTGEMFDCIENASKSTGIHRTSIIFCCAGSRKYTLVNGNTRIVWMYLEDYQALNEDEVNQIIYEVQKIVKRTTGKAVACVTTGEYFNSISEASRQYDIDKSSIVKCCRGKLSYCGKNSNGEKLIWKYAS